MKFSTVLLALATTSFAFAEITNTTPFKDATFVTKLTKECREDLEAKGNLYQDCIETYEYDYNSIEDMCNLLSSKKCKDFYKDPLAVVPKCANDELFKKDMTLYKGIDSSKTMNCLVNAEGKLCPTIEQSAKGQSLTDEAVLETCKSKACTEALIEAFQRSIDTVDLYTEIHDELLMNGAKYRPDITKEKYGGYIEILKSEQCTSQAKDDVATYKYLGADEKSGASTIKFSGALITTFGLLLSYLL